MNEEFLDSVERRAKHLLTALLRPIVIRETFPFEVLLWIGTVWFLKSLVFSGARTMEYVVYWQLRRAGWPMVLFAVSLFLSTLPIFGVFFNSGIVRRVWLAGEIFWWAYIGIFYQLSRPENPNSIVPLLFAVVALICHFEQTKRDMIVDRVRRLIEEDGGKE